MREQTVPEKVLDVLVENIQEGYLTVKKIDKIMVAELPPEFRYLAKGSTKKVYNSMQWVRKLCDEQGLSLIQRGTQKNLSYKIAEPNNEKDAIALKAYLMRQKIRKDNANETFSRRLEIAKSNALLPEQTEIKFLD